jgi:hypothetical protein
VGSVQHLAKLRELIESLHGFADSLVQLETDLARANAKPLSDALVRRLPVPDQDNRVIYDPQLPGFGVRVTAAGVRSFVLNYRVRGNGRERRYTIGRFPNWRTSAARKRARELRCLIDMGGDPLAEIEAEQTTTLTKNT